MYLSPLHTYVCPIHMYVAIAKVLGGKVSEPRRDDGNRRRITNVDRLSSGRSNARPLFNSPPTCGRTERISRRDGRRLSRLEIQSVLSAMFSTDRGNARVKPQTEISPDLASLLARRNGVAISAGETRFRFAIQNN